MLLSANKRLIELSKPRRTQSDSKLKEQRNSHRTRNNKTLAAKQEPSKLKKRCVFTTYKVKFFKMTNEFENFFSKRTIRSKPSNKKANGRKFIVGENQGDRQEEGKRGGKHSDVDSNSSVVMFHMDEKPYGKKKKLKTQVAKLTKKVKNAKN